MSDAFGNDPLVDARQTLNPLQAMVQRFRQTAAGGPAPQAPPTLEQQAQTAQPHGRQPPDMLRQYANNYLPPGNPYPAPAPWPAFRPASIPRAYQHWGNEEEFSPLPQPFEAPTIARELAQFFASSGSSPVAQIAAAINPTVGAFMNGLQNGQLESARAAKEQLANHIALLRERLEEETYRYRDVLAAHRSLNRTEDPDRMMKPVGGKSLMEDFYDTAVELNDRPLTDLISAGAMPSDVVKFLETRDNRTRDTQKLDKALTEDTADDVRLGMTPESGLLPSQAPTSDVAKYLGGTAYPTTATPSAIAGAPAPAAPPAANLTAGPGVPDGEETATTSGDPNNPLPAWAGKEVTPVVSEIHKALKENKYDPELVKMKPREAQAVALGTQQANSFFDNLLRNPPQDRSRIMPMVRAIDPAMASDLQGVLNYSFPASGGTSGTGASPGTPSGQYSNRLRQLAEAVTGGKWNQGYYQRQQQLIGDHGTQQALGRLTTMGDAGAKMMETLDAMPPGVNSSNFIARAYRTAEGKITGEGLFAQRDSAWLRYNEELQTVIKNTGGSLTELEAGLHTVNPYTGTPEAYRRVLAFDAEIAKDRMDVVQNRYHSIGGRGDIPGFQRESYETVLKIANTEPVNNKQPGAIITLPDGTRARWMGVYDQDGRKIPPGQRYQQVD